MKLDHLAICRAGSFLRPCVIACAFVAAMSFASAQQAAPAEADAYDNRLAQPALDTRAFKEGALKTIRKSIGDWTALCQEVRYLNRRFCNLVGQMRDARGNAHGILILSTDKAGKTMAMMRIAASIAVNAPVALTTSFEAARGKQKKNVVYRKELSAIVCAEACDFVFKADSELVYALNSGSDVVVTLDVVSGGSWLTGVTLRRDSLVVKGKDFSSALAASSTAAE